MAPRQVPLAEAKAKAQRTAAYASKTLGITEQELGALGTQIGTLIGLMLEVAELLAGLFEAVEALQAKIASLETAWDNDHPGG